MPESIYNIPVAFAFGAGMLAAFNPCGSAMLPAYVGYHLSSEGKITNPLRSTLHGLYLGAVVTSGFVFLSLAVGFIITIGGDIIFGFIPFAGLGVGIVITLLGFWLLITGKHIGIWTATRINARTERSVKGVFIFGMLYAISSLGCAFPIFLAAMGILAGQSLGELHIIPFLLRFASYGLGMGMILTGITIGVIFFRELVSRLLRLIFPYIDVVGNITLIGAGSYLIWYWTIGDGAELLNLSIEKLF